MNYNNARHDSRLITAAKRTIRAEVTLVVVVAIITSWSVYALYRISVGNSADSLFGLSLSKLSFTTAHQQHATGAPKNLSSESGAANEQQQMAHYLQRLRPDDAAKYRARLASELMAGQRELQNELASSIQDHRRLQIPQFNPSSAHTVDLSQLQGFLSRLPPSSLDSLLLEQHKAHQQTSDPGANLLRTNRSNNIQLAPLAQLKSVSRPSSQVNFEVGSGATLHDSSGAPLDGGSADNENNGGHHGTDADSGDRQTAESNRDSGESMVESVDGGGSLSESDTPTTSSDESLPGDEPELVEEEKAGDQEGNDSQDGDIEQQTAAPAAASHSSDDDDNAAGGGGSPSSSDVEDEQQPTERTADGDDPSLKEGPGSGHVIDEEVDRMTQPSSGVASRQDKPFDYKNTVQFDDTLTSTSGAPSASKLPQLGPVEPGNLIARFEDPKSDGSGDKTEAPASFKSRGSSKARAKELDLQVDHNRPQVLNGANNEDYGIKKPSAVSRGQRLAVEPSKRNKRSFSKSPLSPIGSTEEIDNFFDRLELDRLLGNRSTQSIQPSSLSAGGELFSYEAAGSGRRETLATDDSTNNHQVAVNVSPTDLKWINLNKVANGSDSHTIQDLSIEESKRAEDKEELMRLGHTKDSPSDKIMSRRQSSGDNHSMLAPATYHYGLSSNDSALQALLAQRQLLDALTAPSQLPSPTLAHDSGRAHHQDTARKPRDRQAAANKEAPAVEEGLLLYPVAGDGEDGGQHESMKGEKKEKSGREKMKKKMTVAYKKGGHKKKKHKKEEKKYLKEKKFKGAKKGKKVAKGKGGQGGKKGKKLYKDKGFKKKGFKNVYHKEEFGQKKSYFDEFRDKDFKKKWKKFDDKYNYAQMKKWQAKDVKGAKKMKDHGEKFKKYDKSRWKKQFERRQKEHKAAKKNKKKKVSFF